jgi:hypothetical protein
MDEAFQTDRSLWRVSSTLLSHIASDQILQPLASFVTSQSIKEYLSMILREKKFFTDEDLYLLKEKIPLYTSTHPPLVHPQLQFFKVIVFIWDKKQKKT